MPRTKTASRMASRAIGALLVCLCFACSSWADAGKDRKKAAKSLAQEIERSQLHKVYIADFLDPAGTRTDKGCFFASTFSTNLAKEAHNFEVVNRIQAQKHLNELHISAQDLLQPETFAKAAQALDFDAVVGGAATITAKDANLHLSLRDAASGKEVHSMDYHEKLQPAFDSFFPAIEDGGIHFYYFPGLDGVSQPKCKHCPNPDYTDKARGNKFEGSVMLSVVIDEKGTVQDIRVVEDPGYGLAQKSIDFVRKWRMEPTRDPQGTPVTIRVGIEIVFRLC